MVGTAHERVDRVRLTPWLDIHCDNRLCSWLSLSFFLLLILGQSLVPDSRGLGVFLFIITAKKVNFLLLFLLSSRRGLRWIQSCFSRLRSVSGVWFGSIAMESGKIFTV
jgi:hypothetical protein